MTIKDYRFFLMLFADLIAFLTACYAFGKGDHPVALFMLVMAMYFRLHRD